MPISANSASLAEAGRSITTPSASSTSAAPHCEDAARLPCLTMGTPAAAATMVAIVDTFTVWAPSPPVPTRSVTGPAILDRRGVRQHRRGQAGHLRGGFAL